MDGNSLEAVLKAVFEAVIYPTGVGSGFNSISAIIYPADVGSGCNRPSPELDSRNIFYGRRERIDEHDLGSCG